ncbi:LuxR family two component transcriptional regulator [Motilibacter rhizosphaerae]|uniref:LuxR family two component transcriptional regulator n=1 Tax=Motilibacter rhizosphaerae TaxID=598652 RepID=A0A4Q7NX72_9ACTN|nr:response regulator transcription factor [Motilibacter rhizosphaerae]RZS91814.1 LuxR family two component transcriptional regulator [Motilibacter rhizosphaerae]
MISVLVADDQALVRAGFRVLLETQDDLRVVAEAQDGAEAVSLARQHRPDVVLMDIRMPVLDGLEATRRVVAEPDPPKVLVLTTFDGDAYVYDALKAGASGFLLKSVPPEQLLHGIRSCAAGDALLAPVVTRRLIEQFVNRLPPGRTAPQLEVLTARELDILREVARGHSNAEIAAELYLSEATVKTHVSRVLQKLGLRDRAQAVVVAYETGVVTAGGG